jgi:ATPase family associated with various cellular activities (AAA)
LTQANRTERMRNLRRRAEKLNGYVVDDLRSFRHPHDEITFMRLPSIGPEDQNDIGVTVTCTGLMTLAVTHSFKKFYDIAQDAPAYPIISTIFDKFLSFRWASSKLPENNAFTVSLVLRAAAIISHELEIDRAKLLEKKRVYENTEWDTRKPISAPQRQLKDKSLTKIAQLLAEDTTQLAVLAYSPSPAIAYWFFEAVDRLQIEVTKAQWKDASKWIGNEFRRQISLVSAAHDALLDPIALAMAACLCKRLKTKADQTRDLQEEIVPNLPSEVELRHGIHIFLSRQSDSGIWPKYFPMFHYPGAGANHCWTFEVLEAVLYEFPDVVDSELALGSFETSVKWCENYRLKWLGNGWRNDNDPFHGWNSGGQQTTLENGEPESWATGVVHMFLWRLRKRLSESVQRQILEKYQVKLPPVKDESLWNDGTIDSKIKILGEETPRSLKTIINEFVIKPISKSPARIKLPEGVKRSALLFGPPGTGKTRFVRAVAHAIGWNFLPITPSAFLADGLAGIYVNAQNLFRDLRDLSRTVVFFDEMDAMLQRRVSGSGAEQKVQLTFEQQFLTTSMLPHLADLYDDGKVLFFVATNYGKTFDDAIIRPGRFDMLLFIGPPDWATKIESIAALAKLSAKDKAGVVQETLREWIPPEAKELLKALDRATFGEMKSLFWMICQGKALDVAIVDKTVTRESFCKHVENWKSERFCLCANEKLSDQYDNEKDTSEIRWE